MASKTAQTFGLCLTHNRLKVCNIQKLIDFYKSRFGMKHLSTNENETTGETSHFLGFTGNDGDTSSKEYSMFELISQKNQQSKGSVVNIGGKDAVYWKIGVNMPDLDLAVDKLRKYGTNVSDPSQFLDVGYLCHLKDPDSFSIELLQFYFEGRKQSYPEMPTHPLGQQPIFGMITLRVADIEASLKFYRDILGMKLICKEDISIYGFHLYFLAFTEDDPPNSDINAVENREWTYQRKCTVIELQAYIHPPVDMKFKELKQGDTGFAGLGFGTTDAAGLKSHIERQHNKPVTSIQQDYIFKKQSFTTIDPDGIPVRFVEF